MGERVRRRNNESVLQSIREERTVTKFISVKNEPTETHASHIWINGSAMRCGAMNYDAMRWCPTLLTYRLLLPRLLTLFFASALHFV